MIIKSILIDEETFNEMGVGFSELPLDKPLEMRGLGRTVVLAGPNGAGKSRLLRLIQKLASRHLNKQSTINVQEQILRNTVSTTDFTAAIERMNIGLGNSDPEERLVHRLLDTKNALMNTENILIDLKRQLKCSSVLNVGGEGELKIVSFVPKQPKLVDPFLTTEFEADQRANGLSHRTDEAETNAPAYAQRVM